MTFFLNKKIRYDITSNAREKISYFHAIMMGNREEVFSDDMNSYQIVPNDLIKTGYTIGRAL